MARKIDQGDGKLHLKDTVFKFTQDELDAVMFVILKTRGKEGLLDWVQEKPEHEALFRQYQIKTGFDILKSQAVHAMGAEDGQGVTIEVKLTGHGDSDDNTTITLPSEKLPETCH